MSRWVLDSSDYREPSSRVSFSSNTSPLVDHLLSCMLLQKGLLALEVGETCLELPMENVIDSGPLDLCVRLPN